MSDKLTPGECPADRVEAVIRDARNGLYAGLCGDDEAVDLCVRMGLVRIVYPEGVGTFLGMGKLEIVR